jgi:hypothetical protein
MPQQRNRRTSSSSSRRSTTGRSGRKPPEPPNETPSGERVTADITEAGKAASEQVAAQIVDAGPLAADQVAARIVDAGEVAGDQVAARMVDAGEVVGDQLAAGLTEAARMAGRPGQTEAEEPAVDERDVVGGAEGVSSFGDEAVGERAVGAAGPGGVFGAGGGRGPEGPTPGGQGDDPGPQHLPRVQRVSLERSEVPTTHDEFLWWAIRDRQQAVSWNRYERFINSVLCASGIERDGSIDEFGGGPVDELLKDINDENRKSALEGTRKLVEGPAQYIDRVRGWQMLKEATELFLMAEAGLAIRQDARHSKLSRLAHQFSELGPRDPLQLGEYERHEFARRERGNYLVHLQNGYQGLPYIKLILEKLVDLPLKPFELVHNANCYGIQYEEVNRPVMLELIWSYWMEQGMLVQTLAALSLRFQNKRVGDRDPLANLEIDPLRGVSNLLWGYIQDEQNRLSVQRRAYEYVHEYGLELTGTAVPRLRPADRRAQFLRSFHDLLSAAYEFYQADDDNTVHADPFPVLNALQTLHMVLSEAAHNQFGDLPWTSRVEMMCQQWILSRPELREFIGGRIMVPYRETWMDRVDAMRQLQGWGTVSIIHFRDLATYGEMLLLTVRWGGWSTIIDPDNAANWARAWRPMVYMYLHAYKMVTGVDLAAQVTSNFAYSERYEQPAYHLERMYAKDGSRAQRARNGAREQPREAQVDAPPSAR